MVSLTMEEQDLIDKGCNSTSSSIRLRKMSLLAFAVGLFSCGVVVSSTAWQFVQGEINRDDFLDALCFSMIGCSWFFLQWNSTRGARLAQSALLKLYESSHCVSCGQSLTVEKA